MPHEIQATDRFIRVIFTGHFTEADRLELGSELPRVEATYKIFPDRMLDFTAVEKNDFEFPAIERRAAAARARVYPNPFKLALVAPKPLDYGCARMYQILNDNPQVDLKIFKTRSEAEEWLASAV